MKKYRVASLAILSIFLFVPVAYATTTVFSAAADIWAGRFCTSSVRGLNAAVCDLRERVTTLEAVTVPTKLIARDADGEYVGDLIDGIDRGVVYNETEQAFMYFNTYPSLQLGWGDVGEYVFYGAYFESSDCSGTVYTPSSTEIVKDIVYYLGNNFYIYRGDMSDLTAIIPGSYLNSSDDCLISSSSSGSMSAYPIEKISWPASFTGPLTIASE